MESDKTKYAWIIEQQIGYFPIRYVAIFGEKFDWTVRTDEALRLSRAEDAEALICVLQGLEFVSPEDVKAVEYRW